MKLKILAVAGLGMVLGIALPAQATWITIGITGIVDSVEDLGPGDGYLDGLVNVGDSITGYYTYDADTLDSNPLPDVGDYLHNSAPAGIFLTIGPFEFKTDPENVDFVVEIENDYPWIDPDINWDGYLLRSYNNLSLSNGTVVNHISWQLDDFSGNALSNDSLPTTAPVLEDYPDSWTGVIITGGDRDSMQIISSINSVELVPEPSTILLLGFAAAAIRRRK